MTERPLQFSYDAINDTMTIEGIRYPGALFRELGWKMETGRAIKIVSRTDGVLVIKTIDGAIRNVVQLWEHSQRPRRAMVKALGELVEAYRNA